MSAASERISSEHSTEVVIEEASTGDARDGSAIAASVNDKGILEKDWTGRRIGFYRITGILGTGGMGTVYEAAQEHPVRRSVALKIIKSGVARDQVVARFEAERQALAMMEHPNIATVLEAGTTPSGQPFFVMELVRGVPITQYCDKERLTLRQRLALFVEVCWAIQHAHQKGVIHRDIKPSNVLVAVHDGKPVPKVIDFGLAKAIGTPLTENPDYTGIGLILGTLAYMSPEQAGASPDVDTRADVYGLGVLLYELLTGSTPLTREQLSNLTLTEVLWVIREEDPPLPSLRISQSKGSLSSSSSGRSTTPARLQSELRRELDWVVMKAIAKDRSRRYTSASELAADVGRYLDNEPVEARPPSRVYFLRKFARRHRTGVMMASLALLALIAVSVLSTVFTLELDSSLRESNRRAAAFYFERGQAAFDKDEVGPGLLSMVESWRSAVAARDPAWQHTARAALSAWQRQNPTVRFVLSHARAIRNVGFSPDGRTAFTASLDNTVRLWDVATGQPIGEPLVHRLQPNVVVFTADCTRVLTGDEAGVAQFWDAATGSRSGPAMLHGGPVRGLAISSDGRTILATSGTTAGTYELRHWDAATGQSLWRMPLLFAALAAFSQDGRKGFGICTHPRTAWLCSMDLATRRPDPGWKDNSSGGVTYIRSGPIFPGAIGFQCRTVAFTRDGGAALFGGVFRNLTVEEPGGSPADPRIPGGIPGDVAMDHRGLLQAAALSPDGQIALTGGEDSTARLCSTRTGKLLVDPLVHQLAVNCVAFSPDGRTALTGSDDGTVRLWDVATGKRLGVPLVHQAPVRDVAFSPNGKHILTGCEDGQSRLWDLAIESRAGVSLNRVSRSRILAAALSPDGELVVTGDESGEVRLWDAKTGESLVEPILHERAVHAVAFSPDGNTILVGTWSCALLYDAGTGKPVGGRLGHRPGFVRAVAFSADGRRMLTGGDDGFAWLWDSTTGQAIGFPMMQKVPVSGVAFGPDGKTLAIIVDTEVRIYETATTTPRGLPLMHQSAVAAVVYSPDGKTLLTAGNNGQVRLWSVATSEWVGVPLTNQGRVRAIAFSPDSKAFLTGGEDGTVQVWKAPTFPSGRHPRAGGISENGKEQVLNWVTVQPVGEALGGKGPLRAVAYSPNGRSLITATEGGLTEFWDATTRRRLGRPITLPPKLASLKISSSGTTLLGLGQDGMVRLWKVAELPDDLTRVSTWIEVLTGLTTDSEGSIKTLDHAAWQQRRAILDRLGGAP